MSHGMTQRKVARIFDTPGTRDWKHPGWTERKYPVCHRGGQVDVTYHRHHLFQKVAFFGR